MDLVSKVRRRLFFKRGVGNFYAGVFPTQEAARQSIPPSQTEGYDNEAAAGFYRERLEKVFPADYPALFWLRPLITPSAKVFDFGGHVGLHFYSWRKMLDLPATAKWLVADVPAVCAAGAKIAQEKGVASQLSFTDQGLAAGDGCDVLFSGGALQYLEPDALAKAVAAIKQPPAHLILNKIPVAGTGEPYFTVQDTGVFRAAYTVFSRPKLIAGLDAAGYELVDAWECPTLHCHITDARERSIDPYSGLYFRRA